MSGYPSATVYSDFNEFPKSSLSVCPYFPLTDDCRPVLGSDALMNRRTLFERSELGRPPKARVRPTLIKPDGKSLVLGPFAETKGPRLPGRNPATIINFKKFQFVKFTWNYGFFLFETFES